MFWPPEYDPELDPRHRADDVAALWADDPEAEARDYAEADRDSLHDDGYDEEYDRA